MSAYCRGMDRVTRLSWPDVVPALVVLGFTLVGTHGAADSRNHPGSHPMDTGGYVLAGLVASTVLLRRAAPTAGLLACATAVSTYLAIGYAFGPVLLVMGLMAVWTAARLPLTRLLPVGGGALAIAEAGLAIRYFRDPADLRLVALLAAPAWLAVPYAIGTVIQYRKRDRVRGRKADADAAIAAERLRIAAEVHDVAGHGLAVIAMQAGVALHVLERRPEQARIALEEIRAASTEALDGLRATLDSMRGGETPTNPGLPGLGDLPALAERIGKAGVAVELTTSGQAVAVPAAVDHAAYRIVQESLTNVLRHANATRAAVATSWSPDALRISVLDDGRTAPGPEGGGIAGMRARAEAVGGTLHTSLGPGGFEVVATLPLGSA